MLTRYKIQEIVLNGMYGRTGDRWEVTVAITDSIYILCKHGTFSKSIFIDKDLDDFVLVEKLRLFMDHVNDEYLHPTKREEPSLYYPGGGYSPGRYYTTKPVDDKTIT